MSRHFGFIKHNGAWHKIIDIADNKALAPIKNREIQKAIAHNRSVAIIRVNGSFLLIPIKKETIIERKVQIEY